jgi:hypothetical protein
VPGHSLDHVDRGGQTVHPDISRGIAHARIDDRIREAHDWRRARDARGPRAQEPAAPAPAGAAAARPGLLRRLLATAR